MSEDLLAKEKEFHRLNRELDERTKDLMREFDSVLTLHSNNFHYYQKESLLAEGKKNSTSHEVARENPSRNSNVSELENLTIDEIVSNDENPRSEAFVRFLKAKIKLLHDEVQTIRNEYKKKCNYCKELEIENKKLEDSRTKFHNQTISLKEMISKLESSNANTQSEIQARCTEISSLKKEIDALNKELKIASQKSSNLDTRLNRSLEDNEKLRNIVKLNKTEEKELREQIRRLQENERITVKNLERQRSEILQAFKKQIALVDNLKKQKAYLEASRQIQLTEEEFSKLLDWNLEKT